MVFFFVGKERLRQRTHKPRASRNMGPLFFEKKKAPAATYPQVKGFQKFGPLGTQAEKQGFRTAWLITGQKFSMFSKIDVFHANFLRSWFLYMSNVYESG